MIMNFHCLGVKITKDFVIVSKIISIFNCKSLFSVVISGSDAKEYLKKLREGGERKSEEVVELWEDCLADFSYKVSDSECK